MKPTSPLRESATDAVAHLDESLNLTDLIVDSCAQDPDAPVYALRNGTGGWTDVNFSAFLDTVRATARGLMAHGVQPGDRVAIFAPTSYEWAVLDMGILFAGGISVPIYETSAMHQVQHILEDSGTRIVACGSPAQERTAHAAAKEAEVEIVTIPVTDGGLQELMTRGERIPAPAVEAARSQATLATTASIVYTSGTTGKPKGAMITHGNFALGSLNILPFAHQIVGYGSPEPSRTLMFLPLAHVLAHAVQIICLIARFQVAHAPNIGTLKQDMASFHPTWLLAVPRVFEKVVAGAQRSAKDGGKERIFAAAQATAIAYATALEAQESGGSGPGLGLKVRHAVFDRLVYAKLREVLGGNARYAISGASALDPDISRFFRGIGVPLMEGYGLTETTAPATVNIPGASRTGTVGLPIPGTALRIAEDGEIFVSGPIVFAGYYNNEDATAQAIRDGWFATGDLGALDADGYLTVTGRKKELIVTAGGKNVYPTPMEEIMRRHPLIQHVVVVGENRPYVGALVTLDEEELAAWCRDRGMPELSRAEAIQDPQVRAAIQEAVDAVNEEVSRAESVRRFTLLDTEFTEASGHVTQSMKLKRGQVTEDFAAQVEELYA
ncbi:MAG: AMP-dependent synthetase/ligase [Micrococcus sp.]|nr:AMP-dependent synthetase/ligase [Micrococcus sp.]